MIKFGQWVVGNDGIVRPKKDVDARQKWIEQAKQRALRDPQRHETWEYLLQHTEGAQ